MKREKNDINIAVQKLINYICKHQLEILNVYYSWTRTWQIVCMVYHKYVNLFFCTSKNSKAYAFMYAFFPIGYRTLSTECPWFSLFFLQHTIRIVLFWGMFLTQEIEKSLMLSCIKLCVTCVSLRGGCVCVCLYSSTCWFLPVARRLWHTWEVQINDLLLWVFW